MTSPRSRRLLAAALVALLALAGAACSDDGGDDDSSSTSTTAGSTTTDDGTSTTGDDDGTTEPDDDGTTTTTAPGDDDTTTTGPDGNDDLAARLPVIEGYEREIDDDDGDGFAEEHCDGSTPSMQPVEEASADYQGSDAFLSVAALRFGSEDDASAAYEELVATTSGCSSEDGLSVDEGASTDIGDEGMSWELDFGEQGSGVLYVVRAGDEMWYLSLLGGETVEESVLTAYATAVEG